MTDDDLVNRLFRQYTQTEKRIELIKLVQKRQASKWWRFKSKVKGWFK